MSGVNTSSSTLWATASKEWVIQPKPKPGRKPKKDTASTSKDDAETDIKGRRIQNRAAQRAFRERKQSQLSELQARIQSYEQGEIERNIALQNIAKRLKEENEKLREENITLQAELSALRKENVQNPNQNFLYPHKKRWRDESPSTISAQPPQKKKSRTNIDHSQLSTLPATHLPSPSSMVSTPDSNEGTDAQCPSPYDAQPDLSHSSFDTSFNQLTSDAKADGTVLRPFPSLGCGFCDGGDICICHEISVQGVVDGAIEPTEYGNNQTLSHCNQDTTTVSMSVACVENARPSILDNLPAYQPPVPLRRRSNGTSVNSIFPVTIADSRNGDVNCSGDPSNCAACGDDAFGKAFCAAIGNTNSAMCDACPSRTNTQSNSGCCGDNLNCRNCPSTSESLSANTAGLSLDFDVSSEFISTNDAWKKLKAHPNVEFADLSLLAEVVASRSKCLGPRLKMAIPLPIPPTSNSSDQFLNNNSQQFRQRRHESPSLQLVPQEVLLECGRRRMRHVHSDGVNEALRLLDAKFS
ncbi:hypothetical protein BJ912DRAFT_683864 [Pholiota molesta]|nr:hypothetical protein BJ912DRAFT_683864 [Pholiota molesta]